MIARLTRDALWAVILRPWESGETHDSHPTALVEGMFFRPGHRDCHGKRERLARSRPIGGELWITGRASPTATSKLAELGWKLVPKADARLGNYPELAGWN
jgi:hypothetical protein